MADLQQLIAQLNTTDFQASDTAQRALVSMGSAAVEPLTAVLRNAQGRPRTLAISILGAIKDRRAVQPLLSIVQNPSDKDAIPAALALADIGEQNAIPAIQQLIQAQPRGTLNKSLFIALDKLGQHNWVMDFACRVALDKQGHTSDRLAMKEMLEPVNAPATADFILRYLKANRLEPDYLAFGILNKIRSQPVYDYLLELLSNPDPVVRGNAILTLAAADYKDAVKPIKALQRDQGIYKNSDQDGPRETVADLAKQAVKKLQPGWRLW